MKSKTRFTFIACLLLAPLQVFAQSDACPPPPLPLEQQMAYVAKAPARNAGFLWRMEKSGRISWLYGTLHLGQIDFAKPGLQIMQAMRSSDVLAVEINFNEPQDLSSVKPSTHLQLSEKHRERLATAYKKDCLVVSPELLHAGGFQPLLLSQAQRLGMHFGFGPDARLLQIAKRSGKPIVQLETLEQQITALRISGQAEFELFMERQLERLESGMLLEELKQSSHAWQTHNWSLFEELEINIRKGDPESAQRLLDMRDIAMAEKIDSLQQSGKTVFVAVGVLHMVGKTALPKLLEAKGYTVTPVPLRN